MKYSASSSATFSSMGGSIWIIVHWKGTPRMKPINSGGSPMGVKLPPILDTRKMKNTTVCTHLLRHWFARRMGRIITMDAPVVPIQEASRVPISSRLTLVLGVPARSPSRQMLPATQNRPNSSTIKVR